MINTYPDNDFNPNINYLVDTNIIVYSINESSIYYSWCKTLIEHGLNGNLNIFITDNSLYELYAVLTKTIFKKDFAQAIEFIETFIKNSNIKILTQNSTTFSTVVQLLNNTSIQGKLIYDTLIVAIMLENDIDTIITNNPKDFQGFDWLKIITPQEYNSKLFVDSK